MIVGTQLVEMLSAKCGQQMALIDSYKVSLQQAERDNDRCFKNDSVVDEPESLR